MANRRCGSCGGTGYRMMWDVHCQKTEPCPFCVGGVILGPSTYQPRNSSGDSQRSRKAPLTKKQVERNRREFLALVAAIPLPVYLALKPNSEIGFLAGLIIFGVLFCVALVILKFNPWIVRLVGTIIKTVACLTFIALFIWGITHLILN